jgi:RNA polymerase sigma factor (sigma-70 family)
VLLTICRRVLNDPGLAEDAVQETALQAMLSLGRLRHPESFRAWLIGIGINVCYRWRQRRRETWSWEALVGGRYIAEPIDHHSGPEEIVEVADLRRQVQRAVVKLPSGQRAAVSAFYLSGLTQAETADVLGIEISAVKSRLHKARRALRQQLDNALKENSMERKRNPRTLTKTTGSLAGTAAVQRLTNPAEASPEPGPGIEVRIRDIRRYRVEEDGEYRHVVLLEAIGGERILPVWMGQFEASALALQIDGVETPRPLTYAFSLNLLQAAGARLREVRVNQVMNMVFYAQAVIEGPHGVDIQTVDARPSDALNLAMVAGVPIRVDESVWQTEADAGQQTDLERDGFEGKDAIVADLTKTWTIRR